MAKTVFVGLSGGVDSAVSAALLRERGLNVVGVFIKIWQPEFQECNWREERLDAMRIAVHLGIPFREIDLSSDYKKGVVEKMIADYAQGITPNPDVLCNREVKFGSYLRYALDEGADYLATGHYARVSKEAGAFKLLRGMDKNKDQSYFLYTLGQRELSHVLFPVGDIEKHETRKIAAQLKLPVAEKPDSQGLCFVGEITLQDFLKRFLPLRPGPVINMRGEVIGEHPGAALFTIGQRHGFSLSSTSARTPHYVIDIDAKKNTITVSENRDDAAQAVCTLSDLHLTSQNMELPQSALAQTRYREKAVPVSLVKGDGTITVSFFEPHILAPGQSLVLYDENECLGGGIIMRT